MKNIIKLSLITTLLLLLLTPKMIAQQDPLFKVKFLLRNFDKKIKNGSLTIYKNGKYYNTISTQKGKFKLDLPTGEEYLLEFSSDNHYTKRIAFNTELKEDDLAMPKLMLTMSLVPKDIDFLPEEDLDLLDFPVAYLAYDSTAGEFVDLNEEHSILLQQELEISAEKQSTELASSNQ